ncbi:alpha/beta fold hydrolase [Roseateles sp. GG27B]
MWAAGGPTACFDVDRYSHLGGYVQDVLEVCDALGLRATFVGHSVSCSVGILASIARPELFERLILLGPSPCALNKPPDYFGGFEPDDLNDLLEMMQHNYIGWAQYLAPLVAGIGEDSGINSVAGELTDSFCLTDPVAARVFAQTTFLGDVRADLLCVTHPADLAAPQRCAGTAERRPIHAGPYAWQSIEVLDVDGHCAHLSHSKLVIAAMCDYLGMPPVLIQ